MAASNQGDTDTGDLQENNTDASFQSRLSTPKTSPDQQITELGVIFETVEHMLRSPDYAEDLQEELDKAFHNYMAIFQAAKRDLLRNDCGIVVVGETSAGKTTLINQLVGKKLFVTGNLPTTGTIIRIRDAEKMEIQCYTKDETLTKREEVQDEKKLKSNIARLTNISQSPKDFKDNYYVDVCLPVPILKGNVIIVDTPGIGENENLDNILLHFLPHAVSFVFVVNAKETGGIHENRLLKIFKTIMNNREKMPCFDPREILILTNQWDAIEDDDPSSDEDEDGKLKKEDQHTRTWELIQKKIEKAWCSFNIENVFRVSLAQVRKGTENFFTDEYKRFEAVLTKTIDKNENKRIEYYYRFLKHFIQNAERGTLARLNILERSIEEQQETLFQNSETIQDLQSKCTQSRESLEKYKYEIIQSLTTKLHAYLHSRNGREQILNPPGTKQMCEIAFIRLQEEVKLRFKNGIEKWCKGQEAASIIEKADTHLRSKIKDIESKLHEIEIRMTGKMTPDFTMADGALVLLMVLILPFTFHYIIVISLMCLPISLPCLIGGYLAGVDYQGFLIDDAYNMFLSNVSLPSLNKSFEASFGKEYDEMIVRIFEKHLPNRIDSMLLTNKRLLNKYQIIKQKQGSYFRLGEKIRQIQEAIEKFERITEFGSH